MKKTSAFILGVVGLILAVGVPIALGVVFDIDLGKRPGFLVGGMVPGLSVMVWAGKHWKGDSTPKPALAEIPPGCQVCELCGNAVPIADGTTRQINYQTAMTQVAFVCYACSRYRTRRALIILGLFLAALGALVLVVKLAKPGPPGN